jgi:GTP-binding protein
LNKIDAVAEWPDTAGWAEAAGVEIVPVSAVTGEGVEPLMLAVAGLVERVVRQTPEREGFVLHRPLPDSFAVERVGAEWVVTGRAATRAVNLDDLTVAEAADFAAKRLARIGVDAALEAAGAEPGDDVRIGDIVFTYQPGDELEESE